MPYTVDVERIDGNVAELRVTPEQPDAERFALNAGFAAGLLLGAAHALQWNAAKGANERVATGALGRLLDVNAFDELAIGGGQPERFIASVAITRVDGWPWQFDDPAPVATYRIEVTEPRWLEHLSPGQHYESYAYSETGPFHGEAAS